MNFSRIINKKKHNIELSQEEIKWFVSSFVNNTLKDYQVAAFSMAVWFNGMTNKELAVFTKSMIESGITYDVKGIEGPFADKHSTGGVGDKTSLIYAPLVAKFGVKVFKLSGRGLGQTGGTIDKLESCKGWSAELSEAKIKENLDKVKIVIIGQTNNVVPADKKLYALRDVTGTVDSIPLIASSIMSKKLVVPADSIILDVKVGDGAFMKDIKTATKLANTMIDIGKAYNRDVKCLLTNMNKPLGRTIGNALEVKEAWETLQGNGPEDLNEICIAAASMTLVQTKIFKTFEEAKINVSKTLSDGSAAKYLKEFIEAQGGDFSIIENFSSNVKTKYEIKIKAPDSGFVEFVSTSELGYLSMHLGAGRETKEDVIDFAAGIYLNKTSGEFVNKDEIIMKLYTNIDDKERFIKIAQKNILISKTKKNELTILKIIK